jgi:hypothetical protein
MKDNPDYGNINPDSEEEFYEDSVEDWELLGLDPDTPQEEIDKMWENQM